MSTTILITIYKYFLYTLQLERTFESFPIDISIMHFQMNMYSAAVTLFLVMDPLGNIPVFLSLLKQVDPQRRTKIILRESLIAFVILTLFLFCGKPILDSLHISEEALGIAGGIILFLIAIKMLFPISQNKLAEQTHGERN